MKLHKDNRFPATTACYQLSVGAESARELSLDAWNEWISSIKGNAGFGQSTNWAAIRKLVNQADSHIIALERDGRLVAGALFTMMRTPDTGLRRLAKNILGLAGCLECVEGPALAPDAECADLDRLLTCVEAEARRRRIGSINFSAPPATASWLNDEALSQIFLRHGYRRKDWRTSCVELTPDDDMLRSFKQAARKGIRRCREEGVTVSELPPPNGFSRFLETYQTAIGRQVLAPKSVAEQELIARSHEKHYRFFLALNRDGEVLATLGTYSFNGVATEIMSARTARSYIDNVPAQDLLHFEIFRACRDAGDRWFNLAGFNPHPADSKEEGIRRFKEKWSGQEQDSSMWLKPHWLHSLRQKRP